MSVGELVHGRTAAGVPRWAVWTAYAVTAVVLPSGIWRIALVVFHVPLLEPPAAALSHHGSVMVVNDAGYVVGLSVVSELLAFLTVGLVAEWGERLPRRLPWLGGRRIPVPAAVIPAATGAVLLTLLWSWVLIMLALGSTIRGDTDTGIVTHGWQTVAFVLAYVPLGAWGPLLGVVTVHYYRRRRRPVRERALTPRPAR